MQRPLADKRPFGPFAQVEDTDSVAEVNIYFDSEITQEEVNTIGTELENMAAFAGPALGPVGQQDNVVTFTTTGNSITKGQLSTLELDMKRALPSGEINRIELIW